MPSNPRPRRDYDADYDDDLSPTRSARPPPRPRPSRASPPPLDSEVPPKRKSAMRDPSKRRERSRSTSQVRLHAPSTASDSDETIIGEYVRHRNGKIDYEPKSSRKSASKKLPDLEEKTSDRNRTFRARRDNIELDEGEQLRGGLAKAPSRRSPGRRPPEDVETLPERSKGPSNIAGPVAGAVAGAAAGYAAQPRRSHGPPPEAGRRRYDDRDIDPRPPPRSTRPRRPPPEADRDRGYDSDRPRRAPRWGPDDDDLSYVDRRPTRRPKARGAYDDPRYDDRRYDDRVPPRRDARRRAYSQDRAPRVPPQAAKDWKHQGMGLFKEHAVPIIRREGGRMVRQELGKFLAQKAGG